jgi:hypothetical protein
MKLNDSLLAKPTPDQLRWQDLELGMFCHFGINTFCDQEWGRGMDSPNTFGQGARVIISEQSSVECSLSYLDAAEPCGTR